MYRRSDLAEWWVYQEKLDTCEIGYPSSYDPKEPRGKVKGHTIVPTQIKIPHHLMEIDKAMCKIPRPLRETLRIKYTVSGKHDKERAEKSGIKYGTFKLNIDRATCWLDGYFAKR